MEERSRFPPGLPVARPTTSYWQQTPADLADWNSSGRLPLRADYVIVGSGISGASIAHHLVPKKPSASVVLLEARAACSGATGRNGGHTKAASYRTFLAHEEAYGTAEAVKIARLEYATIQRTHELARELEIDCASTPCDSVDIIYSQNQFDRGRNAIRRLVEALGPSDPAANYHIWDADQARDRFLSPDAVGAFSYPAGSLSAYQFAIGLLRHAIQDGLSLYTHSPVTSISPATQDSEAQWKVETPRGTIYADRLILATNGYTAHLLPEMQGLIVPLHGQVIAQRPGTGLPQTGLPSTYSYIFENGYEYMITRPPGSADAGTIVIGGGIHQLPDDGASRFGNTDDGSLDPVISTYLQDCSRRYFGRFWGKDPPRDEAECEWSGIMGASADQLPYVGPVPGRPHLWISASFNGHGMVWCLKSAEALVEMLTGDDAAQSRLDGWFPRSARICRDRMKVRFTGGDFHAPPPEGPAPDQKGE